MAFFRTALVMLCAVNVVCVRGVVRLVFLRNTWRSLAIEQIWRGAHMTSAQGKSLCGVGSNESRVDCRIVVHVESEVVLKWKVNNSEGACDMLCPM